MHRSAAAPGARSKGRAVSSARLGAVVLALAALIFYLGNGWEWGLADDPGLHEAAARLVAQHGLFGGVAARLRLAYVDDRAWGLFRPAYWVYISTVYLLPVVGVYLLRLLVMVGAVALPLVTVSRIAGRGTGWFVAGCAALLLANRPLYDGLSLNIQETCGLIFVAIGIFLQLWPVDGRSPRRRSALAVAASFMIAAVFKAPFIWMSFAYGGFLVLDRRAERGRKDSSSLFDPEAVAVFAASVVLLAAITVWAKQGQYTARAFSPNFDAVFSSFAHLARLGAPPALVLAALAWVLPTSGAGPLRWSESRTGRFAAALIGAGIVYFLNVVPWGAPNYFFSAPIYLVSVGAMLLMAGAVAGSKKLVAPRRRVALWAAAAIAAVVFAHGMGSLYFRNDAICAIRDWALALPNRASARLAINGMESADRLALLLKERSGGKWSPRIQFIQPTALRAGQADYLIVFADQGRGAPAIAAKVVRSGLMFAVYEIDNRAAAQ